MKVKILLIAATLVVAGSHAGVARGEQSYSLANPAQEAAALDTYWTPARLANARELVVTPAGGFAAQAEADEGEVGVSRGTAASGSGAPPSVAVRPDWTNRILDADLAGSAQADESAETATTANESVVPEAAGSFGAFFTSGRVLKQADSVYPYRTVGKLYFTIPGQGDYICSASVVKPRVIVTAGHCVHSGVPGSGAAGFYANFRFVPALRKGRAPFGTWNWSWVTVTGSWANSSGVVPNDADYALIQLSDQVVGGAPRRIGEITGYLGYRTLSLSPNHLNLLGYPANFDSALRMHEVTAQTFRDVAPNCVEAGSDMTGGSSGGPWVMNFGELAAGQPDPGLNRVVGVTSYGYVSPDPKVQGASIFDSRFSELMTNACNRATGNC